jgi:putative DNA methylase
MVSHFPPFAGGGGAIPLVAMRLGCGAMAVDINPVAWFILKCTLEFPQKLAGQKRPPPTFILKAETFMDAFYKANPQAEGSGKTKKMQRETLWATRDLTHGPDADLAWHVRAWGQWVLALARNSDCFPPTVVPTVAKMFARVRAHEPPLCSKKITR